MTDKKSLLLLEEAVMATSAYWCAVARIAEGCKAMGAEEYDRAAGWFALAGESMEDAVRGLQVATNMMLERAAAVTSAGNSEAENEGTPGAGTAEGQ